MLILEISTEFVLYCIFGLIVTIIFLFCAFCVIIALYIRITIGCLVNLPLVENFYDVYIYFKNDKNNSQQTDQHKSKQTIRCERFIEKKPKLGFHTPSISTQILNVGLISWFEKSFKYTKSASYVKVWETAEEEVDRRLAELPRAPTRKADKKDRKEKCGWLENVAEMFMDDSDSDDELAARLVKVDHCKDIDTERLSQKDISFKECIDTFGYESVIATMVYTIEEPIEMPVYKEFNNWFAIFEKLSSSDINNLTDFKKMFKLCCYKPLFDHLTALQMKAPPLPEDIVLYRGVDIRFSAKVGEVFSICNYTSTSVDRNVAKVFTKNCGTLHKYTGMMSGVFLSEMSYHCVEKEVLLFPYQTFEVTGVKENVAEGVLEVTLVSKTRKVLDAYVLLDQECFPFHPDNLLNCTYSLYNFHLLQNTFCFTSANLRQYGYSPANILNETKDLPACHIISIKKPFSSNKSIWFSSVNYTETTYLIPNLKTLIDCYQGNKSLFIKEYYCKDFDENCANEMEVMLINVREIVKIDTQILIEQCQENDPTSAATSFIIGENRNKAFWEKVMLNGFPKHLQNKIQISFVNISEQLKNLKFKCTEPGLFEMLINFSKQILK